MRSERGKLGADDRVTAVDRLPHRLGNRLHGLHSQGGLPLHGKGRNLVGGMKFRFAVRRDQRAIALQIKHRRRRHQPVRPEAREPLHMLPLHHHRAFHPQRGHPFAETPLPGAAAFHRQLRFVFHVNFEPMKTEF